MEARELLGIELGLDGQLAAAGEQFAAVSGCGPITRKGI